jgi:hypothetical protein
LLLLLLWLQLLLFLHRRIETPRLDFGRRGEVRPVKRRSEILDHARKTLLDRLAHGGDGALPDIRDDGCGGYGRGE